MSTLTEEYLRATVEKIAIPRHRFAESANNKAVAQWIENELRSYGLTVFRQGEFKNVVGTFSTSSSEAKILIGAHYDSVPRSPGADDNASAVAGMLAAAKALAQLGAPPVTFVAFNQEEDGLLGSRDFVQNYLLPQGHQLQAVHILEMIAYSDSTAGSQKMPPGMPIKLSDTGDFIAVLANRDSNAQIAPLLNVASQYTPTLPVKALKLFMGVESFFPHLLRSDHAPFWLERIPTFMWTDTANFRNPHYHKVSDTPDTLNYPFFLQVTKLLVANVIKQLEQQNALPK